MTLRKYAGGRCQYSMHAVQFFNSLSESFFNSLSESPKHPSLSLKKTPKCHCLQFSLPEVFPMCSSSHSH